jgi:hypothetical protein
MPPRDYLSTLSGARPSILPDGRLVISMNVLGDMRGLVTLTLSIDGDSATGTWALVVYYVEDPESDSKPDGMMHGTIRSATVRRSSQGRVTGVATAELVIVGGSRSFDGRTGFGRIGAWPTRSGTTLLLSF